MKKRLNPPAAMQPAQSLRQLVKNQWHPHPLEVPEVDPAFPKLDVVQRTAEVFRVSILRAEWWLSPTGSLREWIRLNVVAALLMGVPALFIVPFVTYLLHQFVTWSELLVLIAKNLAIFPILAVVGVGLVTGIVFGARVLLKLLLHR